MVVRPASEFELPCASRKMGPLPPDGFVWPQRRSPVRMPSFFVSGPNALR